MIEQMKVRVALRDRPLLDVIDLSLRFVTASWKLYARMAVVTIVPAYAASVWIGYEQDWTLGWALAIGLGAFAQAPFTMLASKLVFEENVTVRAAALASLRALPRLFAARFVQAMALMVGTIMCFVGLLFTGPAVLYLPEVALLEGLPLGKATSRAQRLAFANSGESVMGWMTLALASFFSAWLVGDYLGRTILETIFEITPPEPLFSAGGNYVAMLGFWLGVPIVTTVRFFMYLNMRTKIEGWDIQARFLALTLRAEEAV